MSKALQIVPGVWQLTLGVVNSFLLETEDGLLLVDTGYPNSVEKLFAAVRMAGQDPSRIQHLILTHCHIDHAGSAAKVQKLTQARTYAHALDAALIEKGVAEREGTKVTPGLVPSLVFLLFIKFAGTNYEPTPIDQRLEHGQVLPLAGGIEVIHIPGHSAGQIALLLQRDKLLIAADLCSHVRGLTYSTINEDINLARQSILQVANYSFDHVVFGHGEPLGQTPNQQLKDKFSGD